MEDLSKLDRANKYKYLPLLPSLFLLTRALQHRRLATLEDCHTKNHTSPQHPPRHHFPQTQIPPTVFRSTKLAFFESSPDILDTLPRAIKMSASTTSSSTATKTPSGIKKAVSGNKTSAMAKSLASLGAKKASRDKALLVALASAPLPATTTISPPKEGGNLLLKRCRGPAPLFFKPQKRSPLAALTANRLNNESGACKGYTLVRPTGQQTYNMTETERQGRKVNVYTRAATKPTFLMEPRATDLDLAAVRQKEALDELIRHAQIEKELDELF